MAHLASYAFILTFLVANRSLPGVWLLTIGTVINSIAIAFNHGVMPATRSALKAAGQMPEAGMFENSTVVAHPNFAFLGDLFAWPAPLPLHNVFSPGDVCIVLGAALVLHQVCQTRFTRLGKQESASVVPLGSGGSGA